MSEATPTTRDGSASARIAEAVRRAILSGEYQPGERIVQEMALRQYSNVLHPLLVLRRADRTASTQERCHQTEEP